LQKADLTTRAVAGFVDLLLIIGLARLPDVLGFLSAAGYLLIRDGLFEGQSAGKKLIGLRVASSDEGQTVTYRESIIRNIPLTLAFMLFLIPYAGWLLGPLALGVECLTAIGDDRGMRIGDMLARTWVMPAVPSASVADRKPDTQTAPPSDAEENQDMIPHDG
jgi:uncharacterized RDD family membrane protein YckC